MRFINYLLLPLLVIGCRSGRQDCRLVGQECDWEEMCVMSEPNTFECVPNPARVSERDDEIAGETEVMEPFEAGEEVDAGEQATPAPTFVEEISRTGQCIKVSLDSSSRERADVLDLRQVPIGNTRSADLLIESCGREPLEVRSVRIEGSDAFRLNELDLPFTVTSVPLGTPLAYERITVHFSPIANQSYEGELIIESDDPAAQPETRIPVIGRGADNECPVAIVSETELIAKPFEVITLDGTPSIDTDSLSGHPSSYEWVIISRPEGSRAGIAEQLDEDQRLMNDDPSTPIAHFVADFVGEYTFALIVIDEFDLAAPSESCSQEEALTTLTVRPEDGLYLELRWNDLAEDGDEVDSDLDLHLMHPEGSAWGDLPYDCYMSNPHPDWSSEDSESKPSLEHESRDDPGPEAITLKAPEVNEIVDPNRAYQVGVEFKAGPLSGLYGVQGLQADVWLRVFINGEELGDYSKRLTHSFGAQNFWHVVNLQWTEEGVHSQEIDRLYQNMP